MRAQFLGMLALSSEFENIAVREEELPELDTLSRSACPVDVKGGAENKHGKVNVLLQVGSAIVVFNPPFDFKFFLTMCSHWLPYIC